MRIRPLVRAATRRPKTTIALWLLLIAGFTFAGAISGTEMLDDPGAGIGESARADDRVEAARLQDPAAERMLVRSGSPAATAQAADALAQHLRAVPDVAEVATPADEPELSTAGGRTVLVVATLRGDPDDADEHVDGVVSAVAAVAGAHPGVRVDQAGAGSISKAFDTVLEEDLGKAGMLSLPITLAVLLLAFGALVAASIPLLLGLTSVAGAMGANALVSQAVPDGGSTSALVLLIGLAVGVDYSLFYIRREREERAAGRGPAAALDAAAATVGRAIVVAGLTVVVSLAGLLITGVDIFASMALGTMVVVAFAVVGSLTVLPATLALLGDRIERGRMPWRRHSKRETPAAGPATAAGRARSLAAGPAAPVAGAWDRIAGAVTRRPVAALCVAVCVLGALAVPALDMKVANPGDGSLPGDVAAAQALGAIEASFPGAPEDAELVVSGRGLDAPRAAGELQALGERARSVTGGAGRPDVRVSADARTALVAVPMPDRGVLAAERAVDELRAVVAPTATRIGPGAEVLVTGDAAGSADFADRMAERTPLVIAFVLGLAFVLLVAAFRSPALAAATMALNLLSVAAAYGILTGVFQHEWAEGLLDFESTGTVTDWLPLFAFVVLFGLSMDYTIIVLERVREERLAGRSPREAAAAAVARTGSTVTSAALVMVAVFAVFAALRMVENKQLGIGLASAILIDATIIRAVALPAVVTLIGERGWRVAPTTRRRPARAVASHGTSR